MRKQLSAPNGDSLTTLQIALLVALLLWSLLLRGWLATKDPAHGRYYDERFGVRNVARILETGSLAPENGFHPSLSYLPALPVLALSEAWADLRGDERFRIVKQGLGTRIGRKGLADGLDFTPLGYRLARWTNCVLGVASILLTFVIGRQIYGFRVAIVGSFLLAAVPLHLRQSGVFKPDIVLVASAMLAFWLSLQAIESGSWRRFALAGVAIGLSLSTKFNAAPVAVPLVMGSIFVGSLAGEGAIRSRLLKLAAALGIAGVFFLALNPFVLTEFAMYRHDFSATMRLYEWKAAAADSSFGDMLVEPFRWLVREVFHGRVVGALGILGLLMQLQISLRRSGKMLERVRNTLLLSFPVGYVAIYSLSSQNSQGWHNWIVLVPFTALAAAWAVVRATEWLSRAMLAGDGKRAITAIGIALVVIFPAFSVHRFVYEGVVPTTGELARELLTSRWRNLEQRIVYQEATIPPLLQGWKRANRFVVEQVESLESVNERTLDVADAEIFPALRLESAGREFYRGRMTSPGTEAVEIEGGWLTARGYDLVLVVHGWERVGGAVDLSLEAEDGGRRFSGRVPGVGQKREFVSLELWLEHGSETRGVLKVGNITPGLSTTRARTPDTLYLSSRVRLRPGREPSLLVELPSGMPYEESTFPVRLHRWRRSSR